MPRRASAAPAGEFAPEGWVCEAGNSRNESTPIFEVKERRPVFIPIWTVLSTSYFQRDGGPDTSY